LRDRKDREGLEGRVLLEAYSGGTLLTRIRRGIAGRAVFNHFIENAAVNTLVKNA
jgi:hypothetical protein